MSFLRACYCCVFVALATAACLDCAQAQAAGTVLARVDGVPLYLSDVQAELEQMLGDRTVNKDMRLKLLTKLRNEIIDRRLVVAYLAARKQAASDADVAAEEDLLRRKLKQTRIKLEDQLQSQGFSREFHRETLRWKLSWQRYLDRYLTDNNLQSYFAQNRKQFDGTELRVLHILFKADVDDRTARQKATQQASDLREQLVKNVVRFQDAARQSSQAPTRENGGEIGWIGRQDPMPESFSAAAFALQLGEVSQPVSSPFGIHLIKVVEAKAGSKTLDDVRAEVAAAATRFLFDWIADQQRSKTEIEVRNSGDDDAIISESQ